MKNSILDRLRQHVLLAARKPLTLPADQIRQLVAEAEALIATKVGVAESLKQFADHMDLPAEYLRSVADALTEARRALAAGDVPASERACEKAHKKTLTITEQVTQLQAMLRDGAEKLRKG
jgi:hypothetical protein